MEFPSNSLSSDSYRLNFNPVTIPSTNEKKNKTNQSTLCSSSKKRTNQSVGTSLNAVKERRFKDEFCYQNCFLIAILNRYFGFHLKAPSKRTVKTHSSPIIQSLVVNGELIEIEKYILHNAKKVFELFQHGGMKLEQGQRHKVENCKNLMTSTYLIDALCEFGFFTESTYGYRHRIVQYEFIERLFYKSKLIFTKKEIMEYGMKLNDYFEEMVEFGKRFNQCVIFEQNSRTLKTYIEECVPGMFDKLTQYGFETLIIN